MEREGGREGTLEACGVWNESRGKEKMWKGEEEWKLGRGEEEKLLG